MKISLAGINRTQKGFTLVELMVAIAIVAILATVGLVVFGNTQISARDAKRKQDIDAIAQALESKYNPETGQYSTIDGADFSGGAVPVDPKTGAAYSGVPSAAVTTYRVCATLEVGGSYCKNNRQ